MSVESKRAPAKIHETSEKDWDSTMAVNVKSIFLGCKYGTAQMLKQDVLPSGDRGWIVNISSIYGLVTTYNIRKYRGTKYSNLRNIELIILKPATLRPRGRW